MTCFWRGNRLSWFLCGWSKLAWFLYASRKSPGLGWSIEFDLVLVWMIELDLTSVKEVEIHLIFRGGSLLTWLLRVWFKFTCFLWRHRNWHNFGVAVGADLFLANASKLTRFRAWSYKSILHLSGDRNWFFSVTGSILTRFLCAASK